MLCCVPLWKVHAELGCGCPTTHPPSLFLGARCPSVLCATRSFVGIAVGTLHCHPTRCVTPPHHKLFCAHFPHLENRTSILHFHIVTHTRTTLTLQYRKSVIVPSLCTNQRRASRCRSHESWMSGRSCRRGFVSCRSTSLHISACISRTRKPHPLITAQHSDPHTICGCGGTPNRCGWRSNVQITTLAIFHTPGH